MRPRSPPGPCLSPARHEPRKLVAHAIDLHAVHEELALVRSTPLADLADQHEAFQVQEQIVELAKAVAQPLFRGHQAASSNATISPSTNSASAVGAGADLTRATAIKAPMTSSPVST